MRKHETRARGGKIGLAGCLIGLCGLLAGNAARGELIYSNIPPDNSLYFIAYSMIDADLATPFTVEGPDNYGFTGAEVGVTWSTFDRPPSVTLTFLLMADAGGLPGQVLEAIDLVLRRDEVPVFAIVGVESVLRPVLETGSRYWLGLSTPRGEFDGGWFASVSLQTGNMAIRKDAGWYRSPGNIDGAFRIYGDPTGIVIPEPAALTSLLLGAALLAGGAARRSRRPTPARGRHGSGRS